MGLRVTAPFNTSRECVECHVPFVPKRSHKKFCSSACRRNNWHKRETCKKIQTHLDEFTYQSLQDMAVELYAGNVSMAVRNILKKALEEWDKEEAT